MRRADPAILCGLVVSCQVFHVGAHAERNGGVSLTQVGGHAGALVFMIGTLAGMAGGFLALLAIPDGAAARTAEEEEIG